MTLALIIAAIILGAANLCSELWRDLMMFQQNSYRPERYSRWLKESGDTTSTARLCGIFITLLILASFCSTNAGAIFAIVFTTCNTWRLLIKKYKKPLVMTARARRIYSTAIALSLIVSAAATLFFGSDTISHLYAIAVALLACYCASHPLIIAANTILKPVESHITNGYIADARNRLEQMPNLKIIGITGSYGKTSTKHYLYRILTEQFDTLMTPGSYNTTLGVVRTIREMLKPYHEVFIVEMGAKQPDDIADICRLVHPLNGIITAVGPQHLESFKTIEAVQATKFELADALPANGCILINNDFDMIASRNVNNTRCLRYAIRNTDGVDYIARNIVYGTDGTDFTVVRTADKHELQLHTRLLGEANISDLLAAVAMAQNMGVADDRIAYAVSQIEHVEHRLSVKKHSGGLTIIDDAFNSNPVGSAMALDVLAAMPAGGRVLVTPGMVELGDEQVMHNQNFGRHAATSADYVIVVSRTNRDAIVAGLKEGGLDENHYFLADTFADAQAILASGKFNPSVILYENDLPDTFK